jgi:cytochrome b561
MAPTLHSTAQYGATAKIFHWMIVALLAAQYPVGWLMPDIHGDMQPGAPMALHISLGIVILALIVARLVWRLTHPVAPEGSLPRWQQLSSEATHWLLYVLVLATTLSGWLFASFRGWSISFFYLVPLPMLAGASRSAIKVIDGWHQALEWALLIVAIAHIMSVLVHRFVYRDRVMQRMLSG